MKKTLILIVSLIIVSVLLLIWFKDEPSLIQAQDLEQSTETTGSVLGTQYKTSADKIPETDSPPVEQEVLEETIEKLPSNVCKDQLAAEYPELDTLFHQMIEEFYLSEDQMMGDGVYQNMSFETLKPLADGNNPEAMMVYGSERLWHSATGIRISRTESQYRTQGQTQEIVKNHQIDLVGISEGEGYLFKAAVFGKVGSIFEASMLLDLTARQMDRKDFKQEVTQDILAKSLAYKKLMSNVFRNDRPLEGIFVPPVDLFNNVQRLYADREDYAEIREQIESQAEIIYLELKQRWEHDREYYGFEIYPDYLQGELEVYGNAYLKCHL